MSKLQFIRNTELAKPYGLSPKYYKDDDMQAFRAVLDASDAIEFDNFDTDDDSAKLYTYHKPVHIKPVPTDMRVRKADQFGFYRTGVTQFLIRAHVSNIYSCHKMRYDCEGPGGQMAYIGNPAWANYWVYQDGCYDKIELGSSVNGLPYGSSVLQSPQPMSSVNVLYGYDDSGMASVYLSRVYGDTRCPGLLRLAEYFHNQGMSVYSFHDSLTVLKVESLGRGEVYGIPSPILLKPTYGNMVRRYPDISVPKIIKYQGMDETFVIDRPHNYNDDRPAQYFIGNAKSTEVPFPHANISDECAHERGKYDYDRECYTLIPSQPASPTDAKVLLSYVTDTWEKGTPCEGRAGISGSEDEEEESEYCCTSCGDNTDEDDTVYVDGEYYCQSCCDRLFVIDLHGHYLSQNDAVYSDIMGEYMSDGEAFIYIESTDSYGANTDYVHRNRVISNNIVTLRDEYEGYDLAHEDTCEYLVVWSGDSTDEVYNANTEGVYVLEVQRCDDYTQVDSTVYDLLSMFGSTNDVYVHDNDLDVFEIWAEKYLLTPRLEGIDVLHRDAEAYAMTCIA